LSKPYSYNDPFLHERMMRGDPREITYIVETHGSPDEADAGAHRQDRDANVHYKPNIVKVC